MSDVLPDREYFEFLAAGRFMLQRSRTSGRIFFYPRIAEPGSGDADLEWVEASGRGTVYATSVVRRRPPQPPYNVALIELEEGVRMMSRVEGIDAEKVAIGMAVRSAIVTRDDKSILIFLPDEQAGTGGEASA